MELQEPFAVRSLHEFEASPLVNAQRASSTYTIVHWVISLVVLTAALWAAFAVLDPGQTLFQFASSLYTTVVIDAFVDAVTVIERYRAQKRIVIEWRRAIINGCLLVASALMAYFSPADYADSLWAVLFAVVASLCFYLVRTNLFSVYSEYRALAQYEGLVGRLDNSMSTGLSAGYYSNFVKKVIQACTLNDWHVANEAEGGKQYAIRGLLVLVHLDDPGMLGSTSAFEALFGHKRALLARHPTTTLAIKAEPRNVTCDIIEYDGGYYILDAPTTLSVLATMAPVLHAAHIEPRDEALAFFRKLFLFYRIDFPGQNKIFLLVPPAPPQSKVV